MQRNGLGYTVVGGVQCDVDEAHTTDFGAWSGTAVANTPAPPAPVPPSTTVVTPSDTTLLLQQIWDQVCRTYPELGTRADGKSLRTAVDALAHLVGDPNA
jgi:hypothetical protein